jgi:S1-C subfamily serine protease
MRRSIRNSGGALLDSAGRLIGIDSAIISGSGASARNGFAIPVDLVNAMPQLIRECRVPVPGIGIVAASEAETARLGIDGVISYSPYQVRRPQRSVWKRRQVLEALLKILSPRPTVNPFTACLIL